MSPSAPQPDHNADPVIQEFHEWVPKHCKLGTNGPSPAPNSSFMPLPDLQAYLKAEKRTTRLLRALYSDCEHRHIIELLEEWYIRVFAILILIGKGRYIEHFVRHESLRDPQLPFLVKPSHFPVDPNYPSFWDLFYEKQFAFCPRYFRYYENNQQLEDRRILPIISKEVLDEGGSAAIYKIKLHPHYDQLNPVGEPSRAYSARPANTYVLKTYNTKDASSYYTNEVNAFMKLTTKHKTDEHLIQFLGSYKQGDTYNILLEYADRGTLEDFFQKTASPSLGEDIMIFWERLFNIIKALRRIHATERPDGFRGPDILIGWHQDVKPKNILVLSGKSDRRYDVEFKLGDLGLSHFKRTVKLDRKIVKADIGGTKDYGAPECFRGDESLEHIELKVKPLIDIWSFGGVCSEAAVWVVLGKAGLDEYRHRRKLEIRDNLTSQDGSCFHDGEKILEAVKNMHDRLLKQGEIRPRDHVTGPVLDQMVACMLEEDPDGRQEARWHQKKSERILKAAQEKLRPPSFDSKPPVTPPQNPNGAGQDHQWVTQTHGPPPNHPRYSFTPGISNTNPAGAPSSLHGSPCLPIANGQPRGQAELCGTAPDESGAVHGEEILQNASNFLYNSSNGLSNVNNSNRPFIPHQSIGGFSPPEAGFDTRRYLTQQAQGALEPASLQFQNHSALGPQLESHPKDSKLTSVCTDHETFHPMRSTMSGEASQSSTPKPPTSSPMANTTEAVVFAELAAQTKKSEIPHLSFMEAKQHRDSRRALPTAHESLLNDLRGRDHVFLIDDSGSMKNYWPEVISLFSVLSYFTKKLDSNGLEMYFTVSTDYKTFKNTKKAVSHLGNMSQSTFSNINQRLEQILGRYREKLDLHKKSKRFSRFRAAVKPLSLYVLTDAAWQGVDAIEPIERMIDYQRELKLAREQVGIQFIRFGNDPVGIQKLEYLDSGLRKKHTKKWDIVDTEPFQDGNLLKMLLGATFNWFDGDDND